ncbi:MAG: LUD domain-containing protein [Bacillota bacterium]|nr:LUD domain-containing protein [Bacillota bacterium]
MEQNNRNIRKEIDEKLNDEVLRGALARFAEAYPIARAKAYENVEDVDALRDSVREMKQATVDNIEKVADDFEAAVVQRGGKFFRAQDGQAVNNYLIDLCQEKGVKKIVKSKSMASEEIHLNQVLEDAGLQVKETDLGEWIISLAHQKPSHMVMPAIHLNKEQIASYFSDELEQDIEPDIAFMVQAARKALRNEFLEADMGISGANFGIAENGAIGLVENEGNARLTTTAPRIHVVIIGYEKLIPTIKDAVPILRTLPRNATGQLLTSYMSMISGPTPILVKQDGKWVEQEKEVYVILLDNGRLEIAKDEKFKQIYQCVRCASCLNVCPIYTLVGGHVYGHIYSGGIGALLTAFFSGMDDFDKINQLCIGCRKCTEICPGKIPIPDLITELRARKVAEKGLPFAARSIFAVMSNRKLFHALLRAGSIGQKPLQDGALIRHLPLFLAGLTKDRSLPAVANKPFRDMVHRVTKEITKPTKRVAFFSGCSIDFVYPETGESVYKVLQDLDIEVVFPLDQSCCGKPIIGVGDYETTRKIAKKNIEAFEAVNPEYIITACPTCTETWHETYVELFKDDQVWKPRAEKLAHITREFSSFVAEEYQKAGRLMITSGGKKVTLHDSCHTKRGLGIYKEPRQLLAATPGYELVEMKDSDKCCGMAGAFGVLNNALSMPILKQKVSNIKESGAEVVAVTCSSCRMQIKGGLDKQAPHIEAKHLADILAENIKD